MQKTIPICQWCYEILPSKHPNTEPPTLGTFIRSDFCSTYCHSRFQAIKDGMNAKKEYCHYCEEEVKIKAWQIEGSYFCNGRCIDLFDHLHTSHEFKQAYAKMIDKKLEYERIEKLFRSLENKFMEIQKSNGKST
jgi:hypothetical protein